MLYDLRGRNTRPFQKLVMGQSDNWVVNNRQTVVRVTPHSGHSAGLIHEGSRSHHGRGNASQLDFHCVVHTARGAGPSFSSGVDHYVAFLG
jgi:hypothetical protein